MGDVSDEPRAPNDYRWARQVSALLHIAVVVVIVVLDVIVDDYEVNPPVLVPLLLTAAGTLLLGIFPGPILELARASAAMIGG